MRIIDRDVLYNVHDRNNKPSAYVSDGEEFLVKTQLNGGDWLQSMDDRWQPGKSRGPNLSVCLYVNGAKAGDTLAVDIIDIQPEELGYTGFAGWRNKLSQKIYPNDWDVVTKTVHIAKDHIDWSDQLKLPIIPMIGTIGTAPAGEPMSNQFAYKHGGNMDVQEVTCGTTIYLPVNVDGALLNVGDVHAIMGDGEINHGGGIECRSRCQLRVRVLKKPYNHQWIRLENQDYLMTVACHVDLQEAFHLAAHELIDWMVEDYGFDAREAYLLFGQVLEARGTIMLGEEDQRKSYICKINKKYLKPDPDFRPEG